MNEPIEPPAKNLQKYTEYLLLLAKIHLPVKLQAKLDPADLVQQSLLYAHQHWDQFRGNSEPERLCWLKTILLNTLAMTIRTYQTEGRDIQRERSLQLELNNSSALIERSLAADQSSPSQRIGKEEELFQLVQALKLLPYDQRQAIELHHLQGLPIKEIATILQRSPTAVVGLLVRGLKKLRECLLDNNHSSS